MEQTDQQKILSNTHYAAKRLLGSYIIHKTNKHKLIGKIVETEIYHDGDPASHSCNGKTNRCEVMFGPPGFSYVYFIYGMYHCFNIVTGPKQKGSAVLVRAIEPIEGIGYMKQFRHTNNINNLTNGPGKLCQALNITRTENKLNLLDKQSPLQIQFRPTIPETNIINTTRIGISQAKEKKYRYYIKNNSFVSKK